VTSVRGTTTKAPQRPAQAFFDAGLNQPPRPNHQPGEARQRLLVEGLTALRGRLRLPTLHPQRLPCARFLLPLLRSHSRIDKGDALFSSVTPSRRATQPPLQGARNAPHERSQATPETCVVASPPYGEPIFSDHPASLACSGLARALSATSLSHSPSGLRFAQPRSAPDEPLAPGNRQTTPTWDARTRLRVSRTRS